MNKIIYIVFVITLLFQGVYAQQVITTSPLIFTDQDEVKVTFHADLGNEALLDYTGDIYAHTGVITDKSTSSSDWKYVKANWEDNKDELKLTKLSANTYQIILNESIRQYYNVPSGEVIKQIAFVFRNADGSKKGKDVGDKDIFAEVSEPGLNVKILSPQNNLILSAGETSEIKTAAVDNDSIHIYVNEKLVSKEKTKELNYTFNENNEGVYKVKVVAKTNTEQIADSIAIFIKGNEKLQALPANAKKGLQKLTDSSVRLVLFAPQKDFIFVLGDFNNWTLDSDYQMYKDGDYFWLEINDLDPDTEYVYQYYIDGKLYIADPYSTKLLDPWYDSHIPNETYPNLKIYPVGKGNGIVSSFQLNEENYQWKNENFSPVANSDLVIYELLLRDFTLGPNNKEGNINGLLGKLEYLDTLNINAVELMPFNEFEGNDSWGYNPSFYFATDKAYGTKNDYKKMIDSLHGRGMAVIMDIVFNHSYGQSPMVQMYFDGDKPAANNPWYNVSSPNTSYSWGYDFNHESQYTKEFMDSVLRYWVEEYKIDGFRFDFTKGFTNKTGDGWAYDDSRISILKRMANKVRSYKKDAILILEHLADNSEEKVLAEHGFLMWGNMNHSFNEATMGYHNGGKSNFSGAFYTSRNWATPNLISYMESHDEERLMYKNLQHGNENGDYSIKDPDIALQRVEMALIFYMCIPGPKMIWQFGELGYDYSIDHNGRVGKKPVKWEYTEDYYRRRLNMIYGAMIGLKTTESTFKTNDFNYSLSSEVKKIYLNHSDMDLVVVGNFDVKEKETQIQFSRTGTWYSFFKESSIDITNTDYTITLKPGEYRLFTSKKLKDPGIPADVFPILNSNNEIFVAPNPMKDQVTIKINETAKNTVLRIYNLNGELVYFDKNKSEYLWNGKSREGRDCQNGMYFIQIQSSEGNYVKKLLLSR